MSFETFYLYVLPILIAAAGWIVVLIHDRFSHDSTPPGE